MKQTIRVSGKNQVKQSRPNEKELMEQLEARSVRISLIQDLIPLGLMKISEELQLEVEELAGQPYSREGSIKRWGSNQGYVYLGEQRCPIRVPRVRDQELNQDVVLESYLLAQDSKRLDGAAFNRVLRGISTRDYEKAAYNIGDTFGLKHSSVSQRFVKASAEKLKELDERDLSQEDIIGIFIDGKRFSKAGVLVAMGVTLEGKKIILGIIESSTEHHKVCQDFLENLIDRGLKVDREILFVIDGAKGLAKGIKTVLEDKAIIQRCQWHKRENVVSYLSKGDQKRFRGKLQHAYNRPTYEEAKAELSKIHKELEDLNQSAASSLQEGLEETLTLHKLGMFGKMGRSFKTTNCIESVNAQLAKYTDRVDYWKNSKQRQRWVAAALLEIEPSLRKVMGHKYLPELREKMKTFNP